MLGVLVKRLASIQLIALSLVGCVDSPQTDTKASEGDFDTKNAIRYLAPNVDETRDPMSDETAVYDLCSFTNADLIAIVRVVEPLDLYVGCPDGTAREYVTHHRVKVEVVEELSGPIGVEEFELGFQHSLGYEPGRTFLTSIVVDNKNFFSAVALEVELTSSVQSVAPPIDDSPFTVELPETLGELKSQMEGNPTPTEVCEPRAAQLRYDRSLFVGLYTNDVGDACQISELRP